MASDWLDALPADVPTVVVHYATGRPFASMMDLDDTARATLVAAHPHLAPRYVGDPTYVPTRRRVEATLHRQLVEQGFSPQRRHPHYGLLGRSARAEARLEPGRIACLLPLDRLPADQVSLTWFDSFTLDTGFRAATGLVHPASGRAWPLAELPTLLARWPGTDARPAWMELEVQLWFDPSPDSYEVVPV